MVRVFDTRSDTVNSRETVRYHTGILPNGFAKQLCDQVAVTIDATTRSVIEYRHKKKKLS